MQRRDFIKTIAGASVCSMLCSSCTFSSEKNIVGSKFLYKSKRGLPKKVRLEASTLCQLNCPACWMRLGEPTIRQTEGFGYLEFKDFKKFVDDNSQIEEIELSNNGEIFLNPELNDIIKYAHEKGIRLTANGGVNLNTLSDETAELLVKCGFVNLIVSIDGATPETYKIYRRGGDFNKVIANIKKINEFKKKYKSDFPLLTYKFIIFNHNVEDIPLAKKIGKSLNMDVIFAQNNQPWYAPLSEEQKARAEKLSGITLEATSGKRLLKEYRNGNSDWFYCDDLFTNPQINWNGNLLGCCVYADKNFGVNVFKEGLLNALNHQNILYAKQMLTDFSTQPKNGIPCSDCQFYKLLKEEKYEMYSDRSVNKKV